MESADNGSRPCYRTRAVVDNLPLRIRQELEHFAIAASALEGKEVRIVGWRDPSEAFKTIEAALVLNAERPTT